MNMELVEKIQNECKSVRNLIQGIHAPMNETNMAIIHAVIGSMDYINNKLNEEIRKGEENGREAKAE